MRLEEGAEVDIESLEHPLVIVLTADCDLEHDSDARFAPDRPADGNALMMRDYGHPSLTPYVQMCDLYMEGEIRGRAPDRHIWRRMKQNQDERYHKLNAAPYAGMPWFGNIPILYFDFKKTFALPTDQVCVALQSGGIGRIALVPHTYLHDVMHRFFGFLGRVGVPD